MASTFAKFRARAAGLWPEALLLPLFAASVLSLPFRGPERTWWLAAWLAGLAALSFAAFFRRRSGSPGIDWKLLLLLGGALAVNGAVAAGGGTYSLWWLLYFPFLALSSSVFGRWWQQGLVVALVAALEILQALPPTIPPAPWGALPRLPGPLVLLALFAAIIQWLYLRRQLRLEESLEEHRRLREEAESFREIEGRGQARLETLSPEGREIRRMSAADKLNRDLGRLLDLTRRAVGARSVVHLRSDGNRLVLRREGAVGAKVRDGWECLFGEGPIGKAAMTGGHLFVSNLERERESVDYLFESGKTLSLMAAPVKEHDVLQGMIVAEHPEADRFTKSEMEIFEGFAFEVNLLVESAKESSQRDRRGETARTVSAISGRINTTLKVDEMLDALVDSVNEVVPYDQCAVYLVDHDRRRIVLKSQRGYRFEKGKEVSFPMDKGFPGYIVSHGQALLFTDHHKLEIVPGTPGDTKMRAFMGLPLISHGETEGVILFAASRPSSFTSYQFDDLKTLANQVANQIGNGILHRQIEKMAWTDGLTGLYNHRYFQERLSDEIERAKRHGQPLSLLLLDIDHFKKLNDTYGHPFGDEVLKGVSKQLDKVARGIDFVARYGGEEFTVILSNTDRKGCRKMAERVLKVVEATRFSFEGKEVTVTVSVGSATFPVDGERKGEIIQHSDQALYEAKHSGRNRHRSYDDVRGKPTRVS